MSEYLTNGAALTHTADRIRAKTGETAQIVWDAEKGFGNAVDAISGSEKIQHADIPDYVKTEALAVAEKVKAVLKSDSIVFLAVSDFHHAGEQVDGWQTNINAGNLHACMALKALAYAAGAAESEPQRLGAFDRRMDSFGAIPGNHETEDS